MQLLPGEHMSTLMQQGLGGREHKLTQMLYRRLRSAGIDPARFFAEPDEIVVFGSRAVGVESPNSDLDVLAVGGVDRFRTCGLHVIPVGVERSKTPEWRDSELATHVAAYGVWISGSDGWRNDARIGALAVA